MSRAEKGSVGSFGQVHLYADRSNHNIKETIQGFQVVKGTLTIVSSDAWGTSPLKEKPIENQVFEEGSNIIVNLKNVVLTASDYSIILLGDDNEEDS